MHKEESNPVYLFFAKPWIFWGLLLSTSRVGATVGFLAIAAVLALIWYTLFGWKWWAATIGFLIWVGPVILFTPLLLYLISGTSDPTVPIGCGRNKETGKLECL